MIKHLKPRTKSQLFLNSIKDFPRVAYYRIKYFSVWHYQWSKTVFYLKNHTWESCPYNAAYINFYDKLWKKKYKYIYRNFSGQSKKLTAEISLMKFIKCLDWLRWTSKFKREELHIDIMFYDGAHLVDPQRTQGCSWVVKKNETLYQALKRMEKERIFLT